MLALFAALRLRMRGFPLERDEGEYAYAGQLILQGIPPYQLEYNMKWPGTYAAYAMAMAIFGQSASGIRIGLVLVTTASALLVYFLARRLFGRAAGVAAAATQALLSISVAALGVYAHAAHFVVLPAVAGFLLLTPHPQPLSPQAGRGERTGASPLSPPRGERVAEGRVRGDGSGSWPR